MVSSGVPGRISALCTHATRRNLIALEILTASAHMGTLKPWLRDMFCLVRQLFVPRLRLVPSSLASLSLRPACSLGGKCFCWDSLVCHETERHQTQLLVNAVCRQSIITSTCPLTSNSPIEVEHRSIDAPTPYTQWAAAPGLDLASSLSCPPCKVSLDALAFLAALACTRRHHNLPMARPEAPGSSMWRRLATVSVAAGLCCLL